jgi:Bacterial transglutaminase-like N-terminal region
MYRFHQEVTLWPHRLMLRPRESRDLRLISSNIAMAPAATVTWAHDIFGNAVATATFQTMAENVVIDSVAELQLDATAWPVFDIAASAISYPFRYSDDEWTIWGRWQSSNIPITRCECGAGHAGSCGAVRPTRSPCSKT